MLWETFVNEITSWYWITIILVMAIGLIGSWLHNTAIPILWAVIMSLVLWIGASVLEPLIFGYQYYEAYSLQWFMVAIFGILFLLVNLTYGYNIITKGNVVE